MTDIAGIPSDIEAEQAVLGSMMISREASAGCLEMLKAADFSRPAHQHVFTAITALESRGVRPDVLTVKAELESRHLITKTGGPLYLHELVSKVPVPASAPVYAARVRDCAVRWRLAEAGSAIRSAALDGSADLAERVDAAYRFLDGAAGTVTPSVARSISELIDPALKAIEDGPDEAQGITTGWSDLDRLIPGLRPGQMVTIGGRPGTGKSVVMLNIAVHAAVTHGLPVLVCSLEMSAHECIERIVASVGGVGLGRLRAAELDDEDWRRIAKARDLIAAAPDLMVNEDPYLTVQGIRSDLRAMARAGHPAQLVVVDYLQLMSTAGKPENRQAEVSAISRGLKLLAKEFSVPVVVGSQLNRGPEMRSDKKPLLADLRESGSVEQDSDIVILLYREDAYEPQSPRAGEIDLIVQKNRQGPMATVTLAFMGHYARIADAYKPAPEWSPSSVIEGAA